MISRRTKRAAIGFFFVGVIALILFFSVERYKQNQEEIERLKQDKAEIKPPPRNTYTVRRESRERERTYSAQIQPWVEAEVPAEIAGRITAVHVEPGSLVETGAVLMELDPTTAQINLRASEARLNEARRLYEEAARLEREEVISRTEAEARRSAYEVAQAEYDAADRQYQLHFIRAPFGGIVNERLVDLGDPVDQNRPVADLVDLSKLRVIFYVNDRDIHALNQGQRLELTLAGLRHQVLSPVVEHIARMADASTRLFRVEAVLENPDRSLPAGISGTVSARVSSYDNLPFVPTSAVRLEGDTATVIKLAAKTQPGEEGARAETVSVEIGPEVDGFYPVLDGLAEGDQVIIR
ncbi:MAG: efflux RND transporter periplasmic adaptor subunit [Verrucomicrobiota bacterium]